MINYGKLFVIYKIKSIIILVPLVFLTIKKLKDKEIIINNNTSLFAKKKRIKNKQINQELNLGLNNPALNQVISKELIAKELITIQEQITEFEENNY